MPVWEAAIAVALSFWLALVACRVTGETDTTPVGAMGKVTQLIFGALSPGALVAFLLERRKPKLAEEFTLPVASGVVAGGSLMGVVLVFWANGGSILKTLFGG